MTPVERSYHGGECCGIRHLHEFGMRSDKAYQREVLNDVDDLMTEDEELSDETYEGVRVGKLWEVVLTDRQITTMPIVARGLKERGFRLVSRFHNNSGTWCNVLHRTPSNNTGKSPFRNIPDA